MKIIENLLVVCCPLLGLFMVYWWLLVGTQVIWQCLEFVTSGWYQLLFFGGVCLMWVRVAWSSQNFVVGCCWSCWTSQFSISRWLDFIGPLS